MREISEKNPQLEYQISIILISGFQKGMCSFREKRNKFNMNYAFLQFKEKFVSTKRIDKKNIFCENNCQLFK